jgi:hypothetical protein
MKSYRPLLLLLLLIPALWWVWPSSEDKQQQPELPAAAQNQRAPDGESATIVDGQGRARAGKRPRPQTDKAPESPVVQQILTDESISNEAAAVQLRDLAQDRSLPPAQRLEALQHGLNLDIDAFADFPKEADLPPELATHLLHEMINHNDSPATQIQAYLALMNHADPETSALACEMLAFMVDENVDDVQPQRLAELGRKKLAEIASGAEVSH